MEPTREWEGGRVLITGAAGNLGGLLARHLLPKGVPLRLMIHRRPLGYDVEGRPDVDVVRADLGDPETLVGACDGARSIVHFAGVLFAPRPERFLPRTNTEYARNLIRAAVDAGVRRFLLVSFPHVEGPTSSEHPATDRQDREPESVHARTRLAEERLLVDAYRGSAMEPVVLRVGMVYARGVLMVDFARRLLARRLLGVWREPTEIHLISLRDFLDATEAALRAPSARGVYNLGDEAPTTLQAFLDRAAEHWGLRRPWRAPRTAFFFAAWCVELWARLFGTAAPLTRDFIRIGMVPYVMDTDRMRRELLPTLTYPTLEAGLAEL